MSQTVLVLPRCSSTNTGNRGQARGNLTAFGQGRLRLVNATSGLTDTLRQSKVER